MKLGLISLGCAKNLIDSELFLGLAKKYNLEITNKNLVIINLTRQNLIQLFYRTIKSVHQVYIDLFICDSI